MRRIDLGGQFKKDLKTARKRHLPIEDLNEIVRKLANDEPLPAANRDHALHGDFEGTRECHIPNTMSVAINITNSQTMSPLEALWTLIQSQKKSVQRELAQRLNATIEAEKAAKVKMTEAEFYAKLDRSIQSTPSGPIYTMGSDESGEDFLQRMLSQPE